MTTTCPACGSRDIRYSRFRTLGERLAVIAGFRPMRCRRCRLRFRGRNWDLSDWVFARCPQCLDTRLEHRPWASLRGWSGKYLLCSVIGARLYQCRSCRHKFLSFRLRRKAQTTEGESRAKAAAQSSNGSK
jgi:predicted Zn-ribbon and HTH transcriptional regulator